MKSNLVNCNKNLFGQKKAFIALLILVICLSCKETECEDCKGVCNPKAKTVKEVSNQIGSVSYSEQESKWLIIVSQDGTYDSQDLGIVCDSLPGDFQQIGMSVLFSGEYKAYDGNPSGPLPGQIYYYLFLSHIAKPND